MKCGTGPPEYAERAGAGRGRSARAHAAAHNMHMHMHMRTVHVSHEQSERREAEAGEGRHCADRVAQQVSLLLLERRGQVGGGALHFECRASSCLPVEMQGLAWPLPHHLVRVWRNLPPCPTSPRGREGERES